MNNNSSSNAKINQDDNTNNQDKEPQIKIQEKTKPFVIMKYRTRTLQTNNDKLYGDLYKN